jgi:hypothetical protein
MLFIQYLRSLTMNLAVKVLKLFYEKRQILIVLYNNLYRFAPIRLIKYREHENQICTFNRYVFSND